MPFYYIKNCYVPLTTSDRKQLLTRFLSIIPMKKNFGALGWLKKSKIDITCTRNFLKLQSPCANLKHTSIFKKKHFFLMLWTCLMRKSCGCHQFYCLRGKWGFEPPYHSYRYRGKSGLTQIL